MSIKRYPEKENQHEIFRSLGLRIQSNSFKERSSLFRDLNIALIKNNILDDNIEGPALKRLSEVLILTLTRYQDRKSRLLVLDLIRNLITKYKSTLKYLIRSLYTWVKELKGSCTTQALSKIYLTALQWTFLPKKNDIENLEDSSKLILIETQAMLITSLSGCSHIFFKTKAYSWLSNFWSTSFPIAKYSEYLSKVPINYENYLEVFILWGYVYQNLCELRMYDQITAYKSIPFDILLNFLIGTKSKISVDILSRSNPPFLKQINHEEFRQKLLPSIQRSVLRNCENVLDFIVYFIGAISLDLSNYAEEFSKIFGTALISKEESTIETAISGSRNLAEQCSDSSAIKTILKRYFAILNGSEGKLTILSQRFGILSGIGSLSYHRASDTQTISEYACEQLFAFTKSEIHEGTLVHVYNQIQLWCKGITYRIPEVLILAVKESYNKNMSTVIKIACYSCLYESLNNSNIDQVDEIISILSSSVSKAQMATSVQIPLINEGLYASIVLLKTYSNVKYLDTKNANQMNLLLEISKFGFLSTKYIRKVPDENLFMLLSFIEKIFLNFEAKLKNNMSELSFSLLQLMICPKSYEVRKEAHKVCRNLLNNLREIDLSMELISLFPKVIESCSSMVDDQTTSTLCKPFLLKCFQHLLFTASKINPTNVGELSLNSFVCAHLPFLYHKKTWVTFLRNVMPITKVESFLLAKSRQIFELVEKDSNNQPLYSNCIKTLYHHFPQIFGPIFIDKLVKSLRNPEFKTISKVEYEIFKYPEGELYDKSVIEAHRNDNTKNIKRESKLYSYKEQMEEIELRKELESKKQPVLNKKQLEAKAAQVSKESSIRCKLKALYGEFEKALNILYSLKEANEFNFALNISEIVPALINLFESPLCSEGSTLAYVSLHKCAFYGIPDLMLLSKVIAYSTLRSLKPFASIDSNWCKEDYKSQIFRLIDNLYNRTCPLLGRHFDEKSIQNSKERRLTAPAFAYLFPLLSYLIHNSKEDDMIEKCMRLICEHSKIRFKNSIDQKISRLSNSVNEITYLKNPIYLPRQDMLRSLLDFMVNASPHLRIDAQNTIIDVVLSANGDEGSAIATSEEVLILIDSMKNELDEIRIVALNCFLLLVKVLKMLAVPSLKDNFCRRVWVTKFDENEECKQKANDLWEACGLKTHADMYLALIDDIECLGSKLSLSLACALEALLIQYPFQVEETVTKLIALYHSKIKSVPQKFEIAIRPNSDSHVDNFQSRLGVALCLTKIVHLIPEKLVLTLANFLLPIALKDKNEKVQTQMLEVGINLADFHGEKCMSQLLDLLQKYLDEAPDNEENDVIRKSVVIIMGTLAKHLDKDDPKVKPIVVKLIETLSTPSQIVQEAVANCLPHLIPAFKDEMPKLVKNLLYLLLQSDKYGERRGAAHGLAGIVKGLGILSLKQLGIMDTLTEAIQDKKNPNNREGALFAFETLCNMLGRLFEPYIILILPNLLLCFGDNSPKVRKATDDTAKAFMVKLSAHGVKLVLPSLLKALDEDSWRTKAGSTELLGAMAFCAPKQLSSCLPSIVPKLMMVLGDSHTKVQKASAQALKQIGSVIRNPEIQAIVPVLLEALQDPASKIQKCLVTMLNTKFVHFIDAPSLALIMPVIERSFRDRSTETRKMAAQIIGNMYSLTDQKDLSPYLPSIIPGLKASLLDPVPEVRAVTARALGAMIKGMGENQFEDLMPWLMETLVSENSSVDRSGAAQGLSEVLGGLGLEKLEEKMPEIISMAERSDIPSHIKDGYIMLFIYLPMVFTQDFISYIGRIINPVLKALADENELVRDTALKAGQRIVNMYADTAIQLLLPELEHGLFDDNWRIRYSSVQLLGDLLYKISGVSGKMTTETADEDDNFGTENSYKAIVRSLGLERRNRVLSGLYMGRCDVSLQVRTAALHVWKIIVSNTPRTLKEILPTLFSLLLGCLASNSYDKQKVAARTLGDLVKKLGERVLPEIIPILERGLESDKPDQRQGVCIGLSEIISSTSREMVSAFVDSLVPTVTKALYDPLPEVRHAAAKTFDSLYSAVGARALDEILSKLMHQLGDPSVGEYTLDGLKQMMAIRSKVILPYLVPQLTQPPANTRALSFLSSVAGDALTKHLPKILPALLDSLSHALDKDNEKQELEYCQSVIISVTNEQGTRTIIDHLLDTARNESIILRRASVQLLYSFCCQNKAPVAPFVPQLIRGLILLFTDSNEQVLHLSWEALNSVTKSLDPKEQIECVNDVRNAVKFAASDFKALDRKGEILLPGFRLEKGIAPLVPIFREAILNGSPAQKEQAADGLSEIISLTSPLALRNSVIHIAGPLIRILGDRYVWNVKVAVLDTLSLLLSKAGSLLRPFIPQLQQTFLKSLSDHDRIVRLRAANAMSSLILVHPRCDPIFLEIHMHIKNGNASNEESSFRETMLFALRMGIMSAGGKISEQIKNSLLSTIRNLMGTTDDCVRLAAASCLGSLLKWLSDDELNPIIKEILDDCVVNDWVIRHGKSVALRVGIKEAFDKLLVAEWLEKIEKLLIVYMTADRVPIVLSGVKGTAYYIQGQLNRQLDIPTQIVYTFSRCMNHSSNEVKQVMASAVVYLAKKLQFCLPTAILKTLIPMLVNGTKEKNTMVKANSEQALVTVLKLRQGDEIATQLLNSLEKGARDSLQDCINKVLKKALSTPEAKEEEFDDTLLSR